MNKIVCIIQHPDNRRRRNFYIATGTKEITTPFSWDECYKLLNKNRINFFVTNARKHLVVREYIEEFEKPFAKLRSFSFKVEVVKEKIREFENWLIQE